jgi:hypothetical protein
MAEEKAGKEKSRALFSENARLWEIMLYFAVL